MTAARTPQRPAALGRRRACPAATLAACLLLVAGCKPQIAYDYGKRLGPHPDSVNGTGVFGEMFENAGHTVYSWSVLSPRLHKRADCIVWFPDDFQPPTAEVIAWLEDWLAEKPDRTLIYVGRDFDAEPAYWQKILPLAPADQRAEVKQRLLDAQTRAAGRRNAAPAATAPAATPPATKPPAAKPSRKRPSIPPPVYFPPTPVPSPRTLPAAAPPGGKRWFRFDTKKASRPAQPLSGEYADDIDTAQTEIELNTRLLPATGLASLLSSGKDRVVSFRRSGASRLILVVNGSFLLNLPLVNHEHRKLAGQLIAEIGPASKRVAFLESSEGGPTIRAKDPDPHQATGIEILAVWPTNWILLQAIAVGLLACFRRWPIFGQPRPGPTVAASDFGRHITALAELMRRSRDRTFAANRLQQWRQKADTAGRDGET